MNATYLASLLSFSGTAVGVTIPTLSNTKDTHSLTLSILVRYSTIIVLLAISVSEFVYN